MDPKDFFSNTELLEIEKEKEMNKARQSNTIVAHLPFQPIFVAWPNMAQSVPAPRNLTICPSLPVTHERLPPPTPLS
jgi:hypothetical protein